MGDCRCREDSHPAALPKLPYALSWWEAVRVLTLRQWKLTVRDRALVRGRLIQVSAAQPCCKDEDKGSMSAFSIIDQCRAGHIVAQERHNCSMKSVLQRIHSSTLRRKVLIQLLQHAHVEGPLWAVQVAIMALVVCSISSRQEHIHLVLRLMDSLPGAKDYCWLCR